MISGILFVHMMQMTGLSFLNFCEYLTELCLFSDFGILVIRDIVNKVARESLDLG